MPMHITNLLRMTGMRHTQTGVARMTLGSTAVPVLLMLFCLMVTLCLSVSVSAADELISSITVPVRAQISTMYGHLAGAELTMDGTEVGILDNDGSTTIPSYIWRSVSVSPGLHDLTLRLTRVDPEAYGVYYFLFGLPDGGAIPECFGLNPDGTTFVALSGAFPYIGIGASWTLPINAIGISRMEVSPLNVVGGEPATMGISITEPLRHELDQRDPYGGAIRFYSSNTSVIPAIPDIYIGTGETSGVCKFGIRSVLQDTNVTITARTGYAVAQTTILVKAKAEKFRITSVETPYEEDGSIIHFLSNEVITIKAQLPDAIPGVPIYWTVVPKGTTAVQGYPFNKSVTTDMSGTSIFTFKPDDNWLLLDARRLLASPGWITNSPLEFDVIASMETDQTSIKLSESGLGILKQDEIDTLRQEYVDFAYRNGLAFYGKKLWDFRINPPVRENIKNKDPQYYKGPYNVMVSSDLNKLYDTVRGFFRAKSINVGGQTISLANADLTINSGYRNPRYNIFKNGALNSNHIIGDALDLKPDVRFIEVPPKGNNPARPLTEDELHEFVFPALYNACKQVDNLKELLMENWGEKLKKIDSETGKLTDDVTNRNATHIHISWDPPSPPD